MRPFNTLTSFVVGVLVVWAAIFAVGYFLKGSTPGYPLFNVFGDFLLGMLAMYIRRGSIDPKEQLWRKG
jgi:fluoride ion exporter CrcB/FEX